MQSFNRIYEECLWFCFLPLCSDSQNVLSRTDIDSAVQSARNALMFNIVEQKQVTSIEHTKPNWLNSSQQVQMAIAGWVCKGLYAYRCNGALVPLSSSTSFVTEWCVSDIVQEWVCMFSMLGIVPKVLGRCACDLIVLQVEQSRGCMFVGEEWV